MVTGRRWDEPMDPIIGRRTYEVTSLEALRVAIQARTEDLVGATVAGSTSVRWIAENMAYELESFLLTERLPPVTVGTEQRVEVLYPDGWLEMLRHTYRERWWMRRWVARRPIRWHTEVRTARLEVELSRYWAFPRANVKLPDDRLGDPIRFAQWVEKSSVQ